MAKKKTKTDKTLAKLRATAAESAACATCATAQVTIAGSPECETICLGLESAQQTVANWQALAEQFNCNCDE